MKGAERYSDAEVIEASARISTGKATPADKVLAMTLLLDRAPWFFVFFPRSWKREVLERAWDRWQARGPR